MAEEFEPIEIEKNSEKSGRNYAGRNGLINKWREKRGRN